MKTFNQYLEESTLSDKIKKFIDNISFEYRMIKDDDISDEDFKKVIDDIFSKVLDGKMKNSDLKYQMLRPAHFKQWRFDTSNPKRSHFPKDGEVYHALDKHKFSDFRAIYVTDTWLTSYDKSMDQKSVVIKNTASTREEFINLVVSALCDFCNKYHKETNHGVSFKLITHVSAVDPKSETGESENVPDSKLVTVIKHLGDMKDVRLAGIEVQIGLTKLRRYITDLAKKRNDK